jgi:hypothetical protein
MAKTLTWLGDNSVPNLSNGASQTTRRISGVAYYIRRESTNGCRKHAQRPHGPTSTGSPHSLDEMETKAESMENV